MGVVNVTPDSFSDGGRGSTPTPPIAHGLALVAERRRPRRRGRRVDPARRRPGRRRGGAAPGPAGRRRRSPRAGVVVSVDTMRAAVAEAALDAGRALVNDVSGGLADPGMRRWSPRAGVPYVAMHWRGHSDRMDELAVYDDVVADVRAELARRRRRAGRRRRRRASSIVLDPGLGFAKTGRAQLGAARAPRRARRARPAAAGRRVPQALPRPAARRSDGDARPRSSPGRRDGGERPRWRLPPARGACGCTRSGVRGRRPRRRRGRRPPLAGRSQAQAPA